jgi:hypothetical protein
MQEFYRNCQKELRVANYDQSADCITGRGDRYSIDRQEENWGTGNHVTYEELTDEENYAIFDSMGVPIQSGAAHSSIYV